MILVDSGPLVALVDKDDQHHAPCVAALYSIKEPMATIWPVLTEVMYCLRRHPRDQQQIWKILARYPIQLLPLGPDDVPGIRDLMSRPADGSRRCGFDPGGRARGDSQDIHS